MDNDKLRSFYIKDIHKEMMPVGNSKKKKSPKLVYEIELILPKEYLTKNKICEIIKTENYVLCIDVNRKDFSIPVNLKYFSLFKKLKCKLKSNRIYNVIPNLEKSKIEYYYKYKNKDIIINITLRHRTDASFAKVRNIINKRLNSRGGKIKIKQYNNNYNRGYISVYNGGGCSGK